MMRMNAKGFAVLMKNSGEFVDWVKGILFGILRITTQISFSCAQYSINS